MVREGVTAGEMCGPDSWMLFILLGNEYNAPAILWNKPRSADVVRFESRKGPSFVCVASTALSIDSKVVRTIKHDTFAVLICGIGLENGLKVFEKFEKAGGSELLCGTYCFRFLLFIEKVYGNWVVNVVGLQY